MEILYISHCVPWPPDKGERIRAHYSLKCLLAHHRVHLACLARSASEASAGSPLKDQCASVMIDQLDVPRAIARGLLHAATGGCLTAMFYRSAPLKAHVDQVLRRAPIRAVVLLSSGMAYYAPTDRPYLADWGDVDSEKRLAYARTRAFGFIHAIEGARLRKVERVFARRAQCTFLTTENELQLFRRFAPEVRAACCGNGVDGAVFAPDAAFPVPALLLGRRYLVFVGMLDYFPNADGICAFARDVLPELRRRDPGLELLVVGRNPTRRVSDLAQIAGVTVTGAVDDVRPYLARALGVVVPLRIARGIQNKVLEALAMGKTVLASGEVCETFTPSLPEGLIRCTTTKAYAEAVAQLPPGGKVDPAIAAATRARFGWDAALRPMLDALAEIERG